MKINFMEKAILKTLIYADIFNYPLKAYEIHKWLIGKQIPFQKLPKNLEKLQIKKKIGIYKDYFFLKKQKKLVSKRIRNTKISKGLILKAKILVQSLKIIPWIKLIGISGGLAMGNACKKDDIDLFIITSKNRLWLSRMFSSLLLFPVRRKRNSKKVKGKFCLNVFVSEDKLEQDRKDLYTAHEILQMKVVWERDGVYQKFLEENSWVFRYLPNWTSALSSPPRIGVRGKLRRGSNSEREVFNWIPAFAGMTMERIAKWVQLKYMGQQGGLERVQEGALYFHPEDYRSKVLLEYKSRTNLISP